MRLVPLLLLLALRGPDTFVVTGTVVDHLKNQPLNYILVTLTSTQDRKLTVSTITAADGRFGFNNVPTGKYSLTAQRRGNTLPQLYQQNDQYSTAIAVGPGLAAQNIMFPLEAPGSISGTVLDQSGEPVRDGQIWLFRKAVSGGRPQIQMFTQHQTDSSGNFHAGHLGPGTYFIAVSARPWYTRNVPQIASQANPELDVAYPITYYGDTTDPASASPITLAEGGSASIQINLRAVPAVHVELGGAGNLVNPMVETLGGNTIPASTNILGVNGRQELAGLAPGRYIFRTMTSEGQRGRLGPAARLDINSNTTITPDELKTTALSGQVTFESGAAEQPVLQFSCGNKTFGGRVLKDGSFRATGQPLEAGQCEVTLTNAPGFYVKSVATAGGKPSADTVDVVEGTDNRLTVVVAKGAMSQLEGVAVQDDKPFSSAMVLLLPEDLSRAALIRRDQSDSDGSFTLPNVLPGRYTLLAIDNGKELAYRDPAVIQPYFAQSTPLEFPRRDNSPVKVNVIARHAN
jgi:hypothetical protein